MLYVSTRGEAPAKRFTGILLEGLASDGGLYVPESFPRVKLSELRGKSTPCTTIYMFYFGEFLPFITAANPIQSQVSI